ncbi:hypothetical protein SASPL_154837 [Salvia splendens]|uniref:PB1 domain-containing protein n=1 Tax=Salvia splendens TaxID=180675 RepID=A0A8X8W116_SALSN|nr:hypothetical protein SASPL_154837 [Salvia splendens]
MLEVQASSAIVILEKKPRGILNSKDMLMRVVAQDLPPGSTLVEKVMTPNPECATVDTPVVDAPHTMHNGKFLHLPVVDKEAVLDVLHITYAAIATAGSTAAVNVEATNTMLRNFWDSAMEFTPDDDDDTRSENSLKMPSDAGEVGRSVAYSTLTYSIFAFKIQDGKGRMHRFLCGTQKLTDLIAAILQRLGDEINRENLPHILYEDEDKDKDKVVLASNNDLQAAVAHARLAGWKCSPSSDGRLGSKSKDMVYAQADTWASIYSTVAAGAAFVTGLGILHFLRQPGN